MINPALLHPALATCLVLLALAGCEPAPIPGPKLEAVVSVEIRFDQVSRGMPIATSTAATQPASAESQLVPTITTTNPAEIGEIVELFSAARGIKPHKCDGVGRITFVMRPGEKSVFDFLPGHDAQFYEFRNILGSYRVPRERWMSVFGRLGIDPARFTPE